MDAIAAATARLELAADLPSIISAACDAFDDMLPALHQQQDPAGGAFTTFVMSAVIAASGRNALLHAPSLPTEAIRHAADGAIDRVTALEAATTLATLGHLLDARLTAAAMLARTPGDRSACLDGAQHARRLATLLAAAAGP
jgi:hypothetical protein